MTAYSNRNGPRPPKPQGPSAQHRVWYEAHITFAAEHKDFAQRLSDKTGWKFSQITDDEVMGPGAWCYLTKSGRDSAELLGLLYYMRDNKCQGLAKRFKMERVMYDFQPSV